MWSLFKKNGQPNSQHKNGSSAPSAPGAERGEQRQERRVLVPMQVGSMVILVPRYEIRASEDLSETHSLPE